MEGLRQRYLGLLTTEEDITGDAAQYDREQVIATLCDRATALYHEKEALFGEERFREVERAILLRNVDRAWMEHIDAMEDLKGSIGLQAYAHRDPVNEYRLVGADMFDAMVDDIRQETCRMILSAVPRVQEVKRVDLAGNITEGPASGGRRTVILKKDEKVGRNDLCPCGSGKKYKKCCGAPGSGNAD
jgi:preprotein translocase subunit SecA